MDIKSKLTNFFNQRVIIDFDILENNNEFIELLENNNDELNMFIIDNYNKETNKELLSIIGINYDVYINKNYNINKIYDNIIYYPNSFNFDYFKDLDESFYSYIKKLINKFKHLDTLHKLNKTKLQTRLNGLVNEVLDLYDQIDMNTDNRVLLTVLTSHYQFVKEPFELYKKLLNDNVTSLQTKTETEYNLDSEEE